MSLATAKRFARNQTISPEKWIPLGTHFEAWSPEVADLLRSVRIFVAAAEKWGLTMRRARIDRPEKYLVDLLNRSGAYETDQAGRAFYSALVSTDWGDVDWEVVNALIPTIGCLTGRVLLGMGAPKAAALAFRSVLAVSGNRTSCRRHFSNALAGLALAQCAARDFTIAIGTANQLAQYVNSGPGRTLSVEVRNSRLLTAKLAEVRSYAGLAESNDLTKSELEAASHSADQLVTNLGTSVHTDRRFYLYEAAARVASYHHGPDAAETHKLRASTEGLLAKINNTKGHLARLWFAVGDIKREIQRGNLDQLKQDLAKIRSLATGFPSIEAECRRLTIELSPT